VLKKPTLLHQEARLFQEKVPDVYQARHEMHKKAAVLLWHVQLQDGRLCVPVGVMSK
jgi:hypothetical protein